MREEVQGVSDVRDRGKEVEDVVVNPAPVDCGDLRKNDDLTERLMSMRFVSWNKSDDQVSRKLADY